jgi:hypothetical protein
MFQDMDRNMQQFLNNVNVSNNIGFVYIFVIFVM